MHGIVGTAVMTGEIHWSLFDTTSYDKEEGFRIRFNLSGYRNNREAYQIVKKWLEGDKVDWLMPTPSGWICDVPRLRVMLADGGHAQYLDGLDWFQGIVLVTPEVEHETDKSGKARTPILFNVYKEDYLLNHSTKVFLSHQGADKPKVRRFCSALKELGYDPWLDEDAMPAGTEVHRGILQGFKDSCAAVFFITPNFKDEAFLRSEVNHAVKRRTESSERFAIVTIVFDGAGKEHVPELLHDYVWKEPSGELEALTEIVRALPIALGLPDWRPGR